jgi:hypothetical protein
MRYNPTIVTCLLRPSSYALTLTVSAAPKTIGGHVMFSMEWFRLDGQNAFVTGAGSGIG